MKIECEDLALVDSNVLIYAFHADSLYHDAAIDVLDSLVRHQAGAVTSQNLAEFSNVLRNKANEPAAFEKIRLYVEHIRSDFHCFSYNSESVLSALCISEMHSVHFFDALLAATMIENGIATIYTENTEDFAKVPGIKAVNPFK